MSVSQCILITSSNPTPGKVINHPKGDDVYEGVVKDYTGEVSLENRSIKDSLSVYVGPI